MPLQVQLGQPAPSEPRRTLPPLDYVGPGDLNGDHLADLVFTRGGGQAYTWLNIDSSFTEYALLNASMGLEWRAFDTGGFNGNTGLVWTSGPGGQVAIWQLSGAGLTGFSIPEGRMGSEWHVI